MSTRGASWKDFGTRRDGVTYVQDARSWPFSRRRRRAIWVSNGLRMSPLTAKCGSRETGRGVAAHSPFKYSAVIALFARPPAPPSPPALMIRVFLPAITPDRLGRSTTLTRHHCTTHCPLVEPSALTPLRNGWCWAAVDSQPLEAARWSACRRLQAEAARIHGAELGRLD